MKKRHGIDPRTLKVDVQKALNETRWEDAGNIYVKLAEGEPFEALWPHRAGEMFMRVGKIVEATENMAKAADLYCDQGMTLKAVAVCKMIAALDPENDLMTGCLSRVARKEAERSGHTPAPGVIAADLDLKDGTLRPAPPDARVGLPLTSPRVTGRLHSITSMDLKAVFSSGALAADQIGGRGVDIPLEDGDIDTAFDRITTHGLGKGIATPFPAEDLSVEIPLDDSPDLARPRRHSRASAAYRPPTAEMPAHRPSTDEVPAYRRSTGEMPAHPAPTGEIPVEQVTGGRRTRRRGKRLPMGSERIFRVLDAESLHWLIGKLDTKTFSAGAVVVAADEKKLALHLIMVGSVEVRQHDKVIEELGEGGFFGELALVADLPWNSTVVAKTEVELLAVPHEVLTELVERQPGVLKALLGLLRDRLLARLLRTSPIFAKCSAGQRADITAAFRFLEVEPGAVLVREEKPADGLFVLIAGRVEVVKVTEGVVIDELAELGPGDVFGEMSVVSGGAALATIQTTSKCWALMLGRNSFDRVVEKNPEMLGYLQAVAETRQRSAETLTGGVDYKIDI